MTDPNRVPTASQTTSSGRVSGDRVPRPSLRDEDAVDHVPTTSPNRVPGRGPWDCPDCITRGRRGYCAPRRCYCGHDICHAAASYTKTTAPNLDNVTALPTRDYGWADRDSDTNWIDKL